MNSLHIDPYAWMLTVPLTGFLLWWAILPADHGLKRSWRLLMELDGKLLGNWLGRAAPQPALHPTWSRACFVLALCAFALTSVFSAAAYWNGAG